MSVPLIAVVGPGDASEQEISTARRVGELLAQTGHGVVCGGLGGVMEAACRGCAEAGGVTVGLLPGLDASAANPFVKVAIATGMGEIRNALVVRAGRAVIAIGGGYGTLSEIGFGLKIDKTVVGINTFELGKAGLPMPGILVAADAEHAVELVTSRASE